MSYTTTNLSWITCSYATTLPEKTGITSHFGQQFGQPHIDPRVIEDAGITSDQAELIYKTVTNMAPTWSAALDPKDPTLTYEVAGTKLIITEDASILILNDGERLGGASASKVVTKATELFTGDFYAMARMKSDPERRLSRTYRDPSEDEFNNELGVARDLPNQPGILPIRWHNLAAQWMMTPRYTTTLEDFGGRINKEEFGIILIRLLEGVRAMHARKIVICDVSTKNILLKMDPRTQRVIDCVLMDFANSRRGLSDDKFRRASELDRSLLCFPIDALSRLGRREVCQRLLTCLYHVEHPMETVVKAAQKYIDTL